MSVEEFLFGLRGTMSRSRKEVVREYFMMMDSSGDGILDLDEIMQFFDASNHPDVRCGRMTEQGASELLLSSLHNGKRRGKVDWAEFLDYFKVCLRNHPNARNRANFTTWACSPILDEPYF